MKSLLFKHLKIGQGVIQELTEEERGNGVILHVRWKGGLRLLLSFKWNYYWISVEKDDSTFKTLRINKEKQVIENLQKVIQSIEQGEFARRKSAAELVAEIVQKQQLVSCMNNTKWDIFRNAMLNEMPFPPPYEIKTLFEDDTHIASFIAEDANYDGWYNAEDFVNLNYKVIEYLAVKTRYYDTIGGSLVYHKVWHDATEVFLEIMKKNHIPYKRLEEDTFIIYGYLK